MKIVFKWVKNLEDYSPDCKSDAVYKDEFSLLDCILTDDGGLGYLSSVPWINAALKNIEAIKNKKITSYDWSRETWSAELSITEVKIYSLQDENYYQIFELETFEMVLRAWCKFIQENIGNTVEYEF